MESKQSWGDREWTPEEKKFVAMSTADSVLRNLRQVERRYKKAFTPTFCVSISDMARDSADVIESLLTLIREPTK